MKMYLFSVHDEHRVMHMSVGPPAQWIKMDITCKIAT